MKKRKYVLVLIGGIIIGTLVGGTWAFGEERRATENILLDHQMTHNVFADQIFLSAVDNNFIDQKFTFSDQSTEDIIRLYSDYASTWAQEMNDTISTLSNIVEEDDFKLLMSAQNGWQNYLENSVSFNRALYYIGSKYNTADSNTYRDVTVEMAQKIRDRTIDLWSYVYTLTGSTTFITDEKKGNTQPEFPT